jgi:hypothetical protein
MRRDGALTEGLYRLQTRSNKLLALWWLSAQRKSSSSSPHGSLPGYANNDPNALFLTLLIWLLTAADSARNRASRLDRLPAHTQRQRSQSAASRPPRLCRHPLHQSPSHCLLRCVRAFMCARMCVCMCVCVCVCVCMCANRNWCLVRSSFSRGRPTHTPSCCFWLLRGRAQ